MRRGKTQEATALVLDDSSAHDELNLAEFPFCLLTSRSYRGSTIKVEREVRDAATSRCLRQEWTVTGNEEHGLPTARDMDVYVALMQLAARDGVDRERRVFFSRYELVKMQRRVPSVATYAQLEASLDRLVGVTIYAKDAFADAKSRRRISQAFGLLDSYRLEDGRRRARDEREKPEGEQLSFAFQRSWVVLNATLHEQWINGGIKALDTQVYYALKSHVARRLFRFLDRVRESGVPTYEVELATLAKLMPLQDPRPSRQLRDLAKAHEELEAEGYLEKVDEVAAARSGRRLVYFFKEAKLDPKAQLLVDRGISASVARSLAERFPDRIADKVEAFDRRDKSTTRSPAGYLRRSIEGDWTESRPKKEKASSPSRKAALPEMTDEDRRAAIFRERFQALDETTRARLGAQAAELARKERVSELRLPLVTARKLEELFFSEFGPKLVPAES
jgi:hypothetical protein